MGGYVRLVGISMPNCLGMLFKVTPEVLSKILFHIWSKLNLPIFLFKVGLFILIKMDSLMFLAKPCLSLPILSMW